MPGSFKVVFCAPQGNCAENTAARYGITREEQDEFAVSSYKRTAAAWEVAKHLVAVFCPGLTIKLGLDYCCSTSILANIFGNTTIYSSEGDSCSYEATKAVAKTPQKKF